MSGRNNESIQNDQSVDIENFKVLSEDERNLLSNGSINIDIENLSGDDESQKPKNRSKLNDLQGEGE